MPARDLTPETHISMSVTQIGLLAAILFAFGGGWLALQLGQGSLRADVTDIKTTVSTVSNTAQAAAREQDVKREQLGKDFLASNQKIADRVNDLNTQLQVQQQSVKITNETLSKISDQLGHISIATGAVAVGHGGR